MSNFLKLIIALCRTTASLSVNEFSNNKLLFILCEHTTNINYLIQHGLFISESEYQSAKLKELDESEIINIFDKIDYLQTNNFLIPTKRKLSKDEIIKICIDDSSKHLLVSFMQIRQGKKFNDIIRNEYLQLKQNDELSFNAYLLVCLFNEFNCPIADDLLFDSLGINWTIGLDKLKSYCEDILLIKEEVIVPRHYLIGNIVFVENYSNEMIVYKSITKVKYLI